MVLIPAGSFVMGNCTNGYFSPVEGNSDELPQHTVYISSFYIGKYEVTKADWDDVYMWATNRHYQFDHPGGSINKPTTHPVNSINYFDAIKWCNAKSVKEGLTPCYYTSVSQTIIYTNGQVNVVNDWVKWTANGYRLPTEAEWEKAARGGVAYHRFPWSDAQEIQHVRANYYSYSSYSYDTSPTRDYHPLYSDITPYTSPVGSFAPNDYGVYDMAGNVSEMCWDGYAWDYYLISPSTDPHGTASVNSRVARGGSWWAGPAGTMAKTCRVSSRCSTSSGSYDAYSSQGFRVVRIVVP